MPDPYLNVAFDEVDGLVVTWELANGMVWNRVPLRVDIHGSGFFSVWGTIASGEGEPVWAEPGLKLTYFGGRQESPGIACQVEQVEGPASCYRATATGPRATITVDLRLAHNELEVGFSVSNPVRPGARRLPLCSAELRFEDLEIGLDGTYMGAHAYGGRTHGAGPLSTVRECGLPFIHGCIGQALPLVYLHQPASHRGVQLEFMLGERPTAWLRPASAPGCVHWCLSWTTERLLEPSQAHTYPGVARIAPYRGRPVEQMRKWRDEAKERYGIVSPRTPEWARKANIIEFNMNPEAGNGFTRLDDPACLALLKSWKEMGFNAIFAVSPNHVGQNWLSPCDYRPCDAVGGAAGERQALEWAHDLGFKIFLWVTTVGIDRDSSEVKEHPDWFTHRPNQKLFYAWDSGAPEFLGYAPDGDPLATGWRQWLKDEVTHLVERGYDGIFVDGCIPRASNHARWWWPGESRNAVEDQVADLADHVRGLSASTGRELITFVEDEGLGCQASCEMTMGRYTATTPFQKKAYWDHGMGGGPAVEMDAPDRIDPEQAREYLLVRYASLLPDGVDNDVLEGYYSEEARPWTVQSLLAGVVPKTHSQHVDDAATFRKIHDAVEVPAEQQSSDHRLKGTAEFLDMVRFCRDEPLVRDAPMTIEGVVVDGDPAVVGILRPGGNRCILGLIQFADRPASVTVRLADPIDVPASQQAQAGHPKRSKWQVREVLRSMVDEPGVGSSSLSETTSLKVEIAPRGFRIFELSMGG